MKRPIDDLDRMIDDLNANREPDNDKETGELADLVELVRGLKELRHTAWPDESFPLRTAIQLSQQLKPADAPQAIVRAEPDLDNTGETPSIPVASFDVATPTRLPRKRQSGLRIGLEIAAAAAILIAFTALMATLFGNLNGGSQPSAPASQPNTMLVSGNTPTVADATASAVQSIAPPVSEVISATPTVVPNLTLPTFVSDPALAALQSAAGFDLRAPLVLAPGLTMLPPAKPLSMGNFTSVTIKYQDANGKDALTITEASPYQDSVETMPYDVFNSAVPQDLGNGTTVSVYQSSTDIQIWWEVGPTSIRLESGGAPGTTVLDKTGLLEIARSMVPVEKRPVEISVPPDAKVQTSDEAMALARTLLESIGGNTAPPSAMVRLEALSAETVLGMPQPSDIGAYEAVWSVTFPNGMPPQGCPQLGVSVCNASSVTVIVDAQTGNILAWHDPSGAWKQP